MEIKEEILKNKTRTKMAEIKIDALINLLSKEGILTHKEFEEEINNLVEKKSDG